MNSVKITYIICSAIGEIFYLAAAVACPLYFTVGYYYWSGFFIFLMFAGSHGFTKRCNSWGSFGET